MNSRKIMIEVTHEEYEKITKGALGDASEISTKELIKEIMRRTNVKDLKVVTPDPLFDPLMRSTSVTQGSLIYEEDENTIKFEYFIKRKD